MEFRALAEVDREAYMAMWEIRQSVEPYLNAAFKKSSLATLACKLRYVPIIMAEGTRENFPPRSKLQKKERIYDCAPQLNYEAFVNGTYEDQLRTYVDGIKETAPHLADFGATEQQIRDFQTILSNAAENILADLTREEVGSE